MLSYLYYKRDLPYKKVVYLMKSKIRVSVDKVAEGFNISREEVIEKVLDYNPYYQIKSDTLDLYVIYRSFKRELEDLIVSIEGKTGVSRDAGYEFFIMMESLLDDCFNDNNNLSMEVAFREGAIYANAVREQWIMQDVHEKLWQAEREMNAEKEKEELKKREIKDRERVFSESRDSPPSKIYGVILFIMRFIVIAGGIIFLIIPSLKYDANFVQFLLVGLVWGIGVMLNL